MIESDWSSALPKLVISEDSILNGECFLAVFKTVFERLVGCVHLSLPGTTWSKTRGPLFRNTKYLLDGLPRLTYAQQQLVQKDYEVLRRSLFVIRLTCMLSPPVSLPRVLVFFGYILRFWVVVLSTA